MMNDHDAQGLHNLAKINKPQFFTPHWRTSSLLLFLISMLPCGLGHAALVIVPSPGSGEYARLRDP